MELIRFLVVMALHFHRILAQEQCILGNENTEVQSAITKRTIGNQLGNVNWTTLRYGHGNIYQSVGSPAAFTVNVSTTIIFSGPPPSYGWWYKKDGSCYVLKEWFYENNFTNSINVPATIDDNKIASARITGNRSMASLYIRFADISFLNGSFLFAKFYDTRAEISNYLLISLHPCPNINVNQSETGKKFLDIAYDGARHYNKTAVYHCSNDSKMFVNQLLERRNEHIRKCEFDTSWSNEDDVYCFKGPLVSFVKMDIINGVQRNVEDLCKVEQGDPNNATAVFSIPDSSTKVYEENEKIDFNANHNGLIAYCNASNGINEPAWNSTVLNVAFEPQNESTICSYFKSDEVERYSLTLNLTFSANPSAGEIQTSGFDGSRIQDISCARGELGCCNVHKTICTIVLHNVTSQDTIGIGYNTNKNVFHVLKTNFNIMTFCEVHSSVAPTTGMMPVKTAVASTATTTTNLNVQTEPASPLSEAAIVGIAVGGFALMIAIAVLIFLIVKRQRKSGFHETATSNPAFDRSNNGDKGSSEQQECTNIIYGTADDLKSGGGSSKEVVDNVLYGTTVGPQVLDEVYSTVNKKKKDANGSELYSAVQKPKKTGGKSKGVDSGASTSGLQSDETYAEVNKDRKKKKDGKKAGKGQENSGFAGDAQQDATYAVVDKKKNKGAKGKKAEEPGPSGLVEEATYAVVDKKDKKPKKDGPDDDLHGSNKP